MSFFCKLYKERRNLEDKYFEMLENAEYFRYKEYRAALKIQCVWRRFLVLANLKFLNHSALIIQKCYRKFCAQRRVKILLVEKQHKERAKFFDEKATKIQKCWRGYFSRKHIFDFLKQREFYKTVHDKNELMKRELDNHYTKTYEDKSKAKFSKELEKIEKHALKKHYLVSTPTIPSIFTNLSTTPQESSALSAVENYIRTVSKTNITIPST